MRFSVLVLLCCLSSAAVAQTVQMPTPLSDTQAAEAASGRALVAKAPYAPPSPFQPETTQVEVALLFDKMRDQKPDFDELFYTGPAYQNNPDAFNDYHLVDRYLAGLAAISDSINRATVIYSRVDLGVDAVNEAAKTAHITGLEADEPVLYHISPSLRFGLLVKNARDLADFSAGEVDSDFAALSMISAAARRHLPAELTFRPLVANPDRMLLPDLTKVNTIVVELVEVKISDPSERRLLLHKRFNGWTPPAKPAVVPAPDGNLLPTPPASPSPDQAR